MKITKQQLIDIISVSLLTTNSEGRLNEYYAIIMNILDNNNEDCLDEVQSFAMAANNFMAGIHIGMKIKEDQ